MTDEHYGRTVRTLEVLRHLDPGTIAAIDRLLADAEGADGREPLSDQHRLDLWPAAAMASRRSSPATTGARSGMPRCRTGTAPRPSGSSSIRRTGGNELRSGPSS